MLEIALSKICFFWEYKSMRILLGKNLKAHKHRNKLTSIIFAQTLGCIIFLLVAVDLEIQQLYSTIIIPNSDITISQSFLWFEYNLLTAENIDSVLIKHKDSIESFGYRTSETASFPGKDNYGH